MGIAIMPLFAGCGDTRESSPEELTKKTSEIVGPGLCGVFTDDQACVCSNSNFGGICRIVTAARHFYQGDQQIGLPHDSISSMDVGANVNLRYCVDGEFNGTCATLAGKPGGASISLLTGNPGNDSITSLRVDRKSDNCQFPASNQVAIFSGNNFDADCAVLTLPPGFARADFPGNIATSDDNGLNGAFGLPNDSISSIKVGTGVHAVFYANVLQPADSQTLYEPGAYSVTQLGPNVDNTVSAIALFPKNAQVAYRALTQDDLNWDQIQGLAHDWSRWYITLKEQIYAVPLLSGLNAATNSWNIQDFPDLANHGCNHFGDADWDAASGLLFIPVEGCIDPYSGAQQPFVAVFQPYYGLLNFVCADELYFQGPIGDRPGRAPLLAINPITHLLYSTQDRIASFVPSPGMSFPLYSYNVQYGNIQNGLCNLDACLQGAQSGDFSHCVLTDSAQPFQDVLPAGVAGATPADSDGFIIPQGGVFSSDGKLFYLTSGSNGLAAFGQQGQCPLGANGGGLHVFDTTGPAGTAWPMIARTSDNYGLFRYEWHCTFSHYEEPEGMDYLDMDNLAGAFRGQLHVLLFSNGNEFFGFSPLSWVKHYDIY